MELKKLRVTGMHCPSCELLVKEELEELDGINRVTADHKADLVTIDGEYDAEKVKGIIAELGYKVEDGD